MDWEKYALKLLVGWRLSNRIDENMLLTMRRPKHGKNLVAGLNTKSLYLKQTALLLLVYKLLTLSHIAVYPHKYI